MTIQPLKTGFSQYLYTCLIYFPSVSSSHIIKLEDHIFHSLETECASYSGFGKTVIAGDLDAKTGIHSNYIDESTNDHYLVNNIAVYSEDVLNLMNIERNYSIYVSLTCYVDSTVRLLLSNFSFMVTNRLHGDESSNVVTYIHIKYICWLYFIE